MDGWEWTAAGHGSIGLTPGERVALQGRLLSSATKGAHGRWGSFAVRVAVTSAASADVQGHREQPRPGVEPDSAPKECEVVVDASALASSGAWLSLRGALKLLGVGATIVAEGPGDVRHSTQCGGANGCAADCVFAVQASAVRLVGVVPEPTQVVRCLRLPPSGAAALFCSGAAASDTQITVSLASALRPCTIHRVAELQQNQGIMAGDMVTAMKSPEILALCADIRAAQGWCSKKRRGGARHPPSAASWEAVLRLENRWKAAAREGMPHAVRTAVASTGTVDAAAPPVELRALDPQLNLPSELSVTEEERRRQYVDERKRPQVLWMIAMLRQLLALRGCTQTAPLHLVDVGGGRGDLALGVAQSFGPDRVAVTVLDVNEKSLAAGRERASASGLTNIVFRNCNIQDQASLAECGADTVDVVFGLHCCGGLTEAAIDLALNSSSPAVAFAICSCCFCSNPHLASLSQQADQYAAQDGPEPIACYADEASHSRDRMLACRLAQNEGNQAQSRAQRAVNAARLAACESQWTQRRQQEQSVQQQQQLVSWLETLPSKSSQNSVLCAAVI